MYRVTLAAMAVLVTAAPALAQNVGAAPTFGQVRLEAGFTPDPYVVNMTSGGDIDASDLGGSCVGQVSDAPDFRLHYTGGDLPLIIRASSNQSDVTLVINRPDGGWSCNDDMQGTTNAGIRYNRPASGQYDIWVGDLNGANASTRLSISEVSQ